MTSHTLIIRTIAICLGLICFMINPLFLSGCDQITPFEFARQDMERELVESSRIYEIEGEPYLVELTLRPSPEEVSVTFGDGMSVFSMAEACDSRSFVASAAACIDTTTLHVQGTLGVTRIVDGTHEELIDDLPILGTYTVHGKQLDNGRIDFGASLIQGALDYNRDTGSFELGRLESRREEASITLDAP